MKAPNTQLATIPLLVATNSICAMTQPDDKPPIILCSAIEFWRHARAADTTTYLCIFKQQDDTPPPQNRTMNLLTMFVDMHYVNFLNSFLMNSHDNYRHQIASNIPLISPLVTKSLHESSIGNQQTNWQRQNDKFMSTFKLDIFDHQTALLALQYYS